MPDAMIMPSNYIIKDILQTVRNGDTDEIRKVCSKYCERYKDDEDFTGILKMVLENLDEKGGNIPNIETFLKNLLQIRRTSFSGTGLWFFLQPERSESEQGTQNVPEGSLDTMIQPY